jgi:hypothetical protein
MKRMLLLSVLLTLGSAPAGALTPVVVQDFEKASPPPSVWVVNIPNENASVQLAAQDGRFSEQQQAKPTHLPYVQAWEASKQLIDTQAVRALVARLRSESVADRTQAMAALEAIAGDRMRFNADGTPPERNRAIAAWLDYAKDLEKAAVDWAPKITEKPSPRNWAERGMAADNIGWRAPHQAFLPLLRQVVANKDDSYADNGVRIRAIEAISKIRHDGLMDYLIDHLDTDLAPWVRSQLMKLTLQQKVSPELQGTRWHGALNQRQPDEDWASYKKRYQEWWEKNKATFVYDRQRVMVEF